MFCFAIFLSFVDILSCRNLKKKKNTFNYINAELLILFAHLTDRYLVKQHSKEQHPTPHPRTAFVRAADVQNASVHNSIKFKKGSGFSNVFSSATTNRNNRYLLQELRRWSLRGTPKRLCAVNYII